MDSFKEKNNNVLGDLQYSRVKMYENDSTKVRKKEMKNTVVCFL